VSGRALGFAALLVAYVVLTLGVLLPSPVLDLDNYFLHLRLLAKHPDWYPWIHTYVMFGQRGPSTLAFLPLFLWVAWRRRSMTPILELAAALVLLNVSVAVVKYATGRLGPLHQSDVHNIFAGGNIYPSGHVSNTIVLYGLIASILPRYRKTLIGIAVFLSVSVGLGTIYLRTHWFSDVLGGWIAGGLVLLALPWVMPSVQRWADAALAALSRRLVSRRQQGVRAEALSPPTAIVRGAHLARRRQSRSMPVSSTARSHSFVATTSSFEPLDERTRLG
jgi:membrane-associated phospholipid phosphatase